MTPAWLNPSSDFVTVSVKVQPRAAHNAVRDTGGPELHVRLTAPPVDNEANVELVRFVSKLLDCPKNSIQIRRGQSSRHKVLEIHGIPPELIVTRLLARKE
ncbi:MAG: DUF167 domain-containing protein [Verrucomicrobiota bacterium]|nr:DUF167 domain-containing protein [Verrucomicrobiota bacterium]